MGKNDEAWRIVKILETKLPEGVILRYKNVLVDDLYNHIYIIGEGIPAEYFKEACLIAEEEGMTVVRNENRTMHEEMNCGRYEYIDQIRSQRKPIWGRFEYMSRA